jgi:hypothetical protein
MANAASSAPTMRIAPRKPMSVTFIRTGERRYAVRAELEGMPIVEMSPAPGYDNLVPHDLQHFIVERALGIDGAIYGQLAAGGTAGTFRAVAASGNSRSASRDRRRRDRKSSQLMRDQQLDCARSERATYVCWHDWLSHSSDPVLRTQAVKMREAAKGTMRAMPREERALYSTEKLIEIRSQFSKLSERWLALKMGEGFTERW